MAMTIEQMTAESARDRDSQALRRILPWAEMATGRVEEGDDITTSQELLVKAGLDWDVAVRPLWRRMETGQVETGVDEEGKPTYETTYEFVQDKNEREVYRTSDQFKLGAVKTKYKPYSNRECFAFADNLAEQGVATWEEAGQQKNGALVFMTMKLVEGFQILDEDQYDLYLFLRTSHNGGTGINVDIVPFRAWCLNQSQLAVKTRVAHWSLTHTSSLETRIKEARETLQLSVDYTKDLQVLMDKLAVTKVDNDQAKKILERAIPQRRARREEMIQEIMGVYEHSATVAPYLGTGYGLLNGTTEYLDHFNTKRSGQARLESVMFAEGKRMRDSITKQLLALAA